MFVAVCITLCIYGINHVFLSPAVFLNHIQSTLVISISVISNNRLSRRENLIPVLT